MCNDGCIRTSICVDPTKHSVGDRLVCLLSIIAIVITHCCGDLHMVGMGMGMGMQDGDRSAQESMLTRIHVGGKPLTKHVSTNVYKHTYGE